MPKTALRPSQPPIQWVPWVLYQAVKQLAHKVTRPHLMPKSRMSGEISLFPLKVFMVWTEKIFSTPFYTSAQNFGPVTDRLS